MTSGAQVLHVLKKDLRESRWPIAAYLFVVFLATGNASEWQLMHSAVLGYSMLFVVLLGMIVAGSFVHADSPIRPDAFWATRPFSPTAMVLSKLCLAALVLVVPALVGEAIALQHFAAAPRAFPGILSGSAWQFGLWLFGAIVVASFTRDLKTFALTLILTPLAVVFIGALFGPGAIAQAIPAFPNAMVSDVVGIVGLVSAITFLLRQYAKRDDRRRMWVIGLVSAIASVAWLVGGGGSRHSALAKTNRVSGPPLRMGPPNAPDLRRGTVSVDVQFETPSDSTKVTLVEPVFRARARDGTVLRLSLYNQDLFGSRRPAVPSGYAWLTGSPDPFLMWGHYFTTIADEKDRARLMTGLTDVTLDATGVAMRPVLVGSIPLSNPSTLRLSGVRITLSKVTNIAGALWLDVTTSRVYAADTTSPDSLGIPRTPQFDFALINDATHEAAALERRTSGGSSGWLVLPGAEVGTDQASLEPVQSNRGYPFHADDAWIRQARLAVYRWVPQYSFPVHLEPTASPLH